jgi:hypothetical protein
MDLVSSTSLARLANIFIVNAQNVTMMIAPAMETPSEIFRKTSAIPATKPVVRIKISGTLIKIAMIHLVRNDMLEFFKEPGLLVAQLGPDLRQTFAAGNLLLGLQPEFLSSWKPM